jgi:hypothetical protein
LFAFPDLLKQVLSLVSTNPGSWFSFRDSNRLG